MSGNVVKLLEEKRSKQDSLETTFNEMFGLSGENQKVDKIRIENTVAYSKHPFKVVVDVKLQYLADDIKQRGIVQPIIVRKYGFEDKYEILSGHRRTEASKIAGLTEINAIIIKATDEQAAQIVVMSNFLQRETILPSERAKSYLLRNDYLKKLRKGSEKAADDDFSHGGKNPFRDKNMDTYEVLSAEFGESKSNIFRYIRLNYLIDELVELVDRRKLKLVIAVDISYLQQEHQRLIYQYFFVDNKSKLEQSMVREIAEYGCDKTLDEKALDRIIAIDTAKRSKEVVSTNDIAMVKKLLKI